jgi:hypothetical protein
MSVWPATAIVLGGWELVAVTTGRPTVTTLAHRAGARPVGRACVLVWCGALAHHLTKGT